VEHEGLHPGIRRSVDLASDRGGALAESTNGTVWWRNDTREVDQQSPPQRLRGDPVESETK
jgi:hypothetical protein